MTSFIRKDTLKKSLRIPREGRLDVTYRCNNKCRHCWICLPENSKRGKEELSFSEIRRLVDEAYTFGCRRWLISGGEPMLREDFAEIFDYITHKSRTYNLNTNGTRITKEIAKLLTRRGSKMIALYGADAEVHDAITRNPGSFEAVMQGFDFLQSVGAKFTVQIVPMKDNFHQLEEMKKLAELQHMDWRFGAAWIWSPIHGSESRINEVRNQRLEPYQAAQIDPVNLAVTSFSNNVGLKQNISESNDFLLDPCILHKESFQSDPYGNLTFCNLIHQKEMKYSFSNGFFREYWETFLPSLAKTISGGKEYSENCRHCELLPYCRWCPAYGLLEEGRFSAPVKYLCELARENQKNAHDWQSSHQRFFNIAGMTMSIKSDIPITDSTFNEKFKHFEVDNPLDDVIELHHHFDLPPLNKEDLGKLIYQKAPWSIFRKGNSWIYITPSLESMRVQTVAVFNGELTKGNIYHNGDTKFLKGNAKTLTFFSTDQVLFADILSKRNAIIIHSSGVILNNQGLLFVGHSTAGKSTMVSLLNGMGQVLCDDRNIIKAENGGFTVYGTWSHGTVPIVSSAKAPLRAIFFLNKAPDNKSENTISPLKDKRKIRNMILALIIKSLKSEEWWDQILPLVGKISSEVPCFTLTFDKSGQIRDSLRDFVS